MGTYYDEITDMQRAGKWKVYLCMSANGLRLDRQYRIYSAVREYYPEREYGYAEKFVRNELIINRLGGGYRALEPWEVRKAVAQMERQVDDIFAD